MDEILSVKVTAQEEKGHLIHLIPQILKDFFIWSINYYLQPIQGYLTKIFDYCGSKKAEEEDQEKEEEEKRAEESRKREFTLKLKKKNPS